MTIFNINFKHEFLIPAAASQPNGISLVNSNAHFEAINVEKFGSGKKLTGISTSINRPKKRVRGFGNQVSSATKINLHHGKIKCKLCRHLKNV